MIYDVELKDAFDKLRAHAKHVARYGNRKPMLNDDRLLYEAMKRIIDDRLKMDDERRLDYL